MDDSAVRPKSLKFKEPVIDVALSPTTNLVASSLITGHVFVHRYSVDGNERVIRQKVHKKSCRSVGFSADGSLLYTASKDRSWQVMDVETGTQNMNIEAAHDKPLNLIKYVNEQVIATGDDAGGLKLWDVRQNKPAFSYNEHVDYISDMVFNADKRHLLATSGDGCLSVYDVRKAKPFHVSANQDDELLSIALLRGGKKVVVGETDGVLGIFTYGQFGDVSDRFPGHPQSIDTICKLTEDLCVTGSSDGLLRIVQLFPHKLVAMAVSCSHDHTVHFWDIGYIFNDDDDDDDEEDGSEDEGDEQLDAQAVAIRISKEIGGDGESDVDIDGYSDASELKDRDVNDELDSDSDGDSDNFDDNTGDDVGASGSDSDGENSEAVVDVDGSVNGDGPGPSTGAGPSVKGGADSKDVAGDDGDDGWGSWGDSDDSDGDDASGKKKKRKLTKKDKLKAKRKALAELANPEQKKAKRKGNEPKASFFADL
ncbi:WD40-repeat-containing domain protein [Kickxella alabastrina]|uniref:WD40-repeat-containing domain protein n=1 Tax=Kickxella alabastrina TaxID=61397 RepID=UPI0022205064|nr:WD40-repeat-containing domain protein [Kickxella alabastrina]KAI7821139.1 WD40-repeat-containing domain protein [Kickxella alabastrina]